MLNYPVVARATSKSSSKKKKPRKKASKATVRTGRVRAADPFELIRWLARSQPDPRKALAELVQNSLDARAPNIRITRQRRAKLVELRILDDGEGVIPEMGREDALAYIATHIGHSRKRDLTPEQRRELMMQGKYGIGLLGFWSIGRVLEMRSKVAGQPAMLLRMHEDSANYEIERVTGRLPVEENWTEIVIRELHRPAFNSLGARRAAEFLGSELRGQLLAHEPRVTVYDRIARGRAPKALEVVPRRFEGERLSLPAELPTASHAAVKVELYVLPAGASESGRVAISQAGTVVYDALTDFDIGDFDRPPWNDRRLTGVLDFSDFEVSPGARRAVVPNAAAAAFVAAVRRLEPELTAVLAAIEARADAEIEANVFRQLARAFREVPRRAPEYDFFEVLRKRGLALTSGPGSGAPGSDGGAEPAGQGAGSSVEDLPDGLSVAEGDSANSESPAELPMAGPLVTASIVPAKTKVGRLGRRRLRVEASDASGLKITRPLDVSWKLSKGAGGEGIEAEGERTAVLQAGSEPANVTVVATVTEDTRTVEASAEVEIVEALDAGEAGRSGIPEPVFVDEPESDWRSRMSGSKWEVNAGHPDFRAASETPKRKLRYLAALLAKEIVLHSFPAPHLGTALERMVEVLTITEGRLERG